MHTSCERRRTNILVNAAPIIKCHKYTNASGWLSYRLHNNVYHNDTSKGMRYWNSEDINKDTVVHDHFHWQTIHVNDKNLQKAINKCIMSHDTFSHPAFLFPEYEHTHGLFLNLQRCYRTIVSRNFHHCPPLKGSHTVLSRCQPFPPTNSLKRTAFIRMKEHRQSAASFFYLALSTSDVRKEAKTARRVFPNN